MLHALLIGLHTAAATISFISGCLVLRPRTGWRRYPVYLHIFEGSLIAAVVFVILVIGVDWRSLAVTPRAVYSGLVLLGLYMVWRALAAGKCWRRESQGWRAAYINHVGFVLISLFDAFVIVLLIVLTVPAWAVTAVAILAVGAGSWVVRRVQAEAGEEKKLR
jgi:hypothetical protein